MRTLGIDPGYGRLGIAVLDGTHDNQTLVHSECFETSATTAFPDRLHACLSRVKEVVATHKPDIVVLENLFFNTNRTTAMHVAEMRGGLMYLAADAKLPLAEYTPNQVKVAVCGNGRGTKDAVAGMLHRLLAIPEKKMLDDEYDAIAVALTHAVSAR